MLTDIVSACIYSAGVVTEGAVVTSTVVLHGQVIIEGVKFLWWVIDGQPARVTVSHALYGTEIRPADKDPERQARALARKLLAGAGAAADSLPARRVAED